MSTNDELINICSTSAGEIDIAKQAWEVWNCVGDHAEAINARQSVGTSFFGAIQRATLGETILTICRVFDDDARAVTIKRATNALRTSTIHYYRRNVFMDYLKSVGAPATTLGKLPKRTDAGLASAGARIIHEYRPKPETSPEFEVVTRVRDKWLAHREANAAWPNPYEKDIKHCLDWAENFIEMTGRCFGSCGMPSRVWSPGMSLKNLLKRASIITDVTA